jgi:GMP synthase-like glutamine amidotransferase
VRALVIQHEKDAPGGHVTTWLEARGAEQDVCFISADGHGCSPRDYDLVVSLGSVASAYDDSLPWVTREAELLRDAAEHDVPVLGICFGSQILARALGGRAMPSEHPEIGWVPVRSDEPELVSEGPWFQWHHDRFSPPAQARLLAENAAGPQAFMLGRSLGVQFHPEVTIPIVGDWVALGEESLTRHRIDPAGLMAETRTIDQENRARAWRLFDAFLAGVGLA